MCHLNAPRQVHDPKTSDPEIVAACADVMLQFALPCPHGECAQATSTSRNRPNHCTIWPLTCWYAQAIVVACVPCVRPIHRSQTTTTRISNNRTTTTSPIVRATIGHPTATPQPTIDIVGTGGDGMDTFNVSTCAGLVMAACGATVAKHGCVAQLCAATFCRSAPPSAMEMLPIVAHFIRVACMFSRACYARRKVPRFGACKTATVATALPNSTMGLWPPSRPPSRRRPALQTTAVAVLVSEAHMFTSVPCHGAMVCTLRL
jgi:hypothetical protein